MTEEERLHEEDLQRIRGFRLMDDDFMNACFKDNIKATELMLRIILEDNKLQVKRIETQVLMKNLIGRDIELDIEALDADGKDINVEIQRANSGAGRKRARYHSSMIDASSLKPSQDFDELPETYVIFITENDVLGGNKPIYHIDRRIQELDYDPFGDGEHIIYVNGANEDSGTELGKLMHDFRCTDPNDMYYEQLAERPRYFKETDEGVKNMCKVIEDMRSETAWRKTVEIAKNGLNNGFSYEQIAIITGLTIEQIKEIAGEKSA